jgi:hypothetical protein
MQHSVAIRTDDREVGSRVLLPWPISYFAYRHEMVRLDEALSNFAVPTGESPGTLADFCDAVTAVAQSGGTWQDAYAAFIDGYGISRHPSTADVFAEFMSRCA